jgi:HK97 family phage major capsid protein
VRDPSWEAEQALRNDLLGACVEALEAGFFNIDGSSDPAAPASICSGAPAVTSTGIDAAAFDADIAEAMQTLIDAGSNLQAVHIAMGATLALYLSLLRGTSGAPAYPGMTCKGGMLGGVPVVVTSGLGAAESDGHALAVFDASQIAFAEGLPIFKTSENATLEMNDGATGDTTTPTGASLHFVSAFQADATALLVQLNVDWTPRRPNVVAVVRGIDLGASA